MSTTMATMAAQDPFESLEEGGLEFIVEAADGGMLVVPIRIVEWWKKAVKNHKFHPTIDGFWCFDQFQSSFS